MKYLTILLLVLLFTLVSWADNCFNCGRPASKDHADGRHFCSGCLSGNVFSEEQALKLQGEAFVFLTNTLGPSFPCSPMKLVDEPEFNKISKQFGMGSGIVGTRMEGVYIDRLDTVYMLSGLRPQGFQGLMVHEYTHAWQRVACPRQERALREGFATLVQHKWLISRGESRLAKGIADCPDPDYGPAMKTLQSKEKQLSWSVLLGRVQAARKLSDV